MIPKIIHFIWFGPLPVPSHIIETWSEKHPDYEIKVWNEKNLPKLKNQKIFDETNKFNEKSDIARYELLYHYGGFYVDCDIICLKNIDSLIENDFYCLMEKKNLISNSVIGCTKHNEIIKKVFESLPDKIDQSLAVWKRTGPLFFTNIIKELTKPFSYYHFNFCKDYSHFLLKDEIQITDKMKQKNKDLEYFFDPDEIYGIQLWMGGKRDNYKKLRKIPVEKIINNINTYILGITKYKKEIVA